ncbi:hypothetical protein FRAAL1989 [Frankia alni ACN14a]|uniref:Uncharacterized protein n=1 Tax=Frankia alni (strain DSM 45986 / CECT 9034 / ACN14a) TaxID=326424 RepID=Q0RP94_FRAAA|nr:hypothetical protein FRAAL1989 [Frankia alni ACN14a]
MFADALTDVDLQIRPEPAAMGKATGDEECFASPAHGTALRLVDQRVPLCRNHHRCWIYLRRGIAPAACPPSSIAAGARPGTVELALVLGRAAVHPDRDRPRRRVYRRTPEQPWPGTRRGGTRHVATRRRHYRGPGMPGSAFPAFTVKAPGYPTGRIMMRKRDVRRRFSRAHRRLDFTGDLRRRRPRQRHAPWAA